MASYVVMESPDRADAAYVRDGFHVWAFLFGPLWLLWNRLWIEALLVFAAMSLIGVATTLSGAPQVAPWLSLLLSVFVGLEGPALRLAAYRRRGWKDAGVVIAGNAGDAEIRHVYAMADAPAASAPAPASTPAPIAPIRPAQSGPVLGLLSYPGSR